MTLPNWTTERPNLDAAIKMRFAASRCKPARIYVHGNARWQQWCSNSNAICNHRFKTRIELRTQQQPLVAEHRGGTHSRMKRPQPQPPHTGGTFHRRPKPLHTEKQKVSCSGFPPSQVPHHSLTPPFIECIVMWCQVSHHSLTPPFIEYIVMWCQVSHHPSLSVLLCDVKSHTTASHHPSLSVLLCDAKCHTALHWVYSYVMSSLTPPFIEYKSHTTLPWVSSYVMSSLTPSFIECIVMWWQFWHHPSLSVFLCDVKSHTTLHQVKIIRNSEDCFPTSFDNIDAHYMFRQTQIMLLVCISEFTCIT